MVVKMTEEKKLSQLPQRQQIPPEAELLNLIQQRLYPKFQAASVMLGEVGETMQLIVSKLVPLLNEKNQKIKQLDEEIRKLKAVVADEVKEKKKK